jgi:hypothetical protein
MLRLATAPARFLLDELGQGAWKAVGTFRPLVARYGLKNVPTPIEIIAELLACHAGAVTKSGALGTPSCGCVTDQLRSPLSRRSIEYIERINGGFRCLARSGGVSVTQPVTVRSLKSAKCWSEWQDLNLRSPRPERGAPRVSPKIHLASVDDHGHDV